MVNDDEYDINIYKINTKNKIDKKKIFICIVIVFIIICIILTVNYITKTITQYKIYKQYELQLNSIQQQEEEKKAKLLAEQERKRKERIPKLSDVRKAKYRKYL